MPDLVHYGLAHAQFETIHPFWDGNGRVGRLLITLLLVGRKVLGRPLLYLSHYINAHKSEYYSRLMDVRNARDWEGWLTFFLRGVIDVSQAATATTDQGVREIDIRNLHSMLMAGHPEASPGEFRKTGVITALSKHRPPEPIEVPSRMAELVSWNDNAKEDAVVLAALAHHESYRSMSFLTCCCAKKVS